MFDEAVGRGRRRPTQAPESQKNFLLAGGRNRKDRNRRLWSSLSPLKRIDIDGDELARQLFRGYLKQILVDGRHSHKNKRTKTESEQIVFHGWLCLAARRYGGNYLVEDMGPPLLKLTRNIRKKYNWRYIEKKQRGKIIYKIIYSGFSSVKKEAVYY